MTKFTAVIVETITTTVVVESNDPKKATQLALEKYENGARDTGNVICNITLSAPLIEFNEALDGISLTAINPFYFDNGFGKRELQVGETVTYCHAYHKPNDIRLLSENPLLCFKTQEGEIFHLLKREVNRYFMHTPVALS